MVGRLFQIVYMLIDKQTCTAKELAETFEVSVRTIYRDIEKLSLAGISVYMNRGKGGGIFLLSDYVLDKTVLTKDEKNEILSSLQALEAVSNQQEQTALE